MMITPPRAHPPAGRPTSEAHPAPAPQAVIEVSSRERTLLQFYRLLLALALLLTPGVFGVGPLPQPLAATWGVSALAYLVLTGIMLLLALSSRPSSTVQAHLTLVADVLPLTCLIALSGGPGRSLDLLLLVNLTLVVLMSGARFSMVYAAFATLTLFATELLAVSLLAIAEPESWWRAGLLGAALFLLAGLARQLVSRLQQSERRVAEREVDLANLSEVNDYVLERLDDGVLVLDHRGRIRLANPAARRQLQLPPAIVGRPLKEVAAALAEEFAQWQAEPARPPGTIRRASDGDPLRVRIIGIGAADFHSRRLSGTPPTYSPLTYSQGALIFLDDLSAFRERLQQNKLAAIGRLTASIAHEVRNPLAAISQAAQLLADGTLNPTDARLVEIILDHSRRIDRLVNEVLALSRRKRPAQTEVDLSESLLSLCQRAAEVAGMPLTVLRIEPPETPLITLVDPAHLEQILSILLQNALIHAAQPDQPLQVRVTAFACSQFDRAVIELCDNGPGVPTEAQEQLFEPFFTTRRTGSGLGLYLARELAEANHLHLRLVPTGKERRWALTGACFSLSLPRSPHPAAPTTKPRPERRAEAPSSG